MNRLYLMAFAFLLLTSCSNDSKYDPLDRGWWIYSKAREVGDTETAINALYAMMYADSNEYIYNDSLCMLYFEADRFDDCIKAVRRSLVYHVHADLIKMGVQSAVNTRDSKSVVELGNLLMEEEPTNLLVMYDIAVHSLQLNQLEETKKWLDRILANPTSLTVNKQQIQSNGSAVDIRLSVCATNLLGVYYWHSGKATLAETMFNQAISQQPNYDAARENLAVLKSKM